MSFGLFIAPSYSPVRIEPDEKALGGEVTLTGSIPNGHKSRKVMGHFDQIDIAHEAQDAADKALPISIERIGGHSKVLQMIFIDKCSKFLANFCSV